MKKINLLLVSLLLALGLAMLTNFSQLFAQEKGNLIKDGGFEEETVGNKPTSWAGYGPPIVAITSDYAHSGKKSLQIKGDYNNWRAETPLIPVDPSSEYVVSYWLKLDVSQGNLFVQYICYGSEATEADRHADVLGVNTLMNYSESIDKFTEESHTFGPADVQPQTAYIRITWKWYRNPKGTAWIDDVSLKKKAEEKKEKVEEF